MQFLPNQTLKFIDFFSNSLLYLMREICKKNFPFAEQS